MSSLTYDGRRIETLVTKKIKPSCQNEKNSYLTKLNESLKEAERGEVVSYTKEQMRAMEK